MVERWYSGFSKDIIIILKVKTSIALNRSFQYLKTHHSSIPEFQHSIWGEAPDLNSGRISNKLMGNRSIKEFY